MSGRHPQTSYLDPLTCDNILDSWLRAAPVPRREVVRFRQQWSSNKGPIGTSKTDPEAATGEGKKLEPTASDGALRHAQGEERREKDEEGLRHPRQRREEG